MGTFSKSKEMILSLFLPTRVTSGQCIHNLTILCQTVIIILGKLKKKSDILIFCTGFAVTVTLTSFLE